MENTKIGAQECVTKSCASSNEQDAQIASSKTVFDTLSPQDFVRGRTPANIAERCLALCRAYIGGEWHRVRDPAREISVNRIVGGISNQLYRVRLIRSSDGGDEPNGIGENRKTIRDIAIKLYEPKRLRNDDDGSGDERLGDIIVLTIMSQNRLTTPIYGIFCDGFISRYVEHRRAGAAEIVRRRPEIILPPIARALARFHHQDVPLTRPNGAESFWQCRQIERMLDIAYERNDAQNVIERLRLPALSQFDIRAEFAWLRETLRELDFVPIFSHNDFLGNNILIVDNDDDDDDDEEEKEVESICGLRKNETKNKLKILLIDFEYSSYGCRGYDIAVFLSQCRFEPNDYDKFDMPSDEVMNEFIDYYIDACDRLHGGRYRRDTRRNNRERILYETKLMMMLFFLFWVAMPMHMREPLIEAIPFDIEANYKSAELYYARYQNFKRRL